MWIYRNQGNIYEVGYMDFHSESNMPTYSLFQVVETWGTRKEAREAVNYLNGGSAKVEVSGTVDIGNVGL